MRTAITKAAEFKRGLQNGVKLNQTEITERVVNFVVNDIPMNQSQIDNFKRAVDYANELGVKVEITIIR